MSTHDNTNNNKTEVRNKISQWIQDEGFELLPEEDPYTDFTLKIKYSQNETAYVLMRKDRKDSISVYTSSDFSPLDRKAFSNLSPGKKREFIDAISASLLNLNLHFIFHPNPEQMQYLQITKDIFFDGLTKDRFFDIICRVLSGMGLAHMAYYKYLNPNGSNSSLRCLFL
ncbi:MAG: DUF2299 family protein [Candidatus Nitrosopolaris sp.]